MKAKDKYDFSRLGKEKDAVLALEWGLSRERIRQFRKRLNLEKHGYVDRDILNQNLIEFLKQNINKPITLIQIKSELKLNFKLSISYVKKLANENNIKVIFKSEKRYEHCFYSYRNGCRCLICKACNSVHAYLYYKHIKVIYRDVEYYVNEYFDLYESDRSFGHKNFYKFMLDDIKKRNLEE